MGERLLHELREAAIRRRSELLSPSQHTSRHIEDQRAELQRIQVQRQRRAAQLPGPVPQAPHEYQHSNHADPSSMNLRGWIEQTESDRDRADKAREWLEQCKYKITTEEEFLKRTAWLGKQHNGTGVTVGMKQVFRAVGIEIRTKRVQRARQARQQKWPCPRCTFLNTPDAKS